MTQQLYRQRENLPRPTLNFDIKPSFWESRQPWHFACVGIAWLIITAIGAGIVFTDRTFPRENTLYPTTHSTMQDREND